MAIVSTNGQSLSVDGRRLWIVGAQLDYARIPSAAWSKRLHAIKEAGLNTIQTAVPWLLHEPRKGKFKFTDECDVHGFCQSAAEAGLQVVLQVGPSIGRGYDGGGLPHWLAMEDDVLLRSGVGLFMQHATTYLSRLIAQISDLQVTQGGPIVAMQVEHAWHCSHEEESSRYLGELVRFLRESGVTVPLMNANDLWSSGHGSIHTWRGQDQLLGHLRQLRIVQPDAPRVVSSLKLAEPGLLMTQPKTLESDLAAQQQLAEVLASGGQFVLDNIHGGTNFGFLAGRLPGSPDRFVATAAATAAPISEGGLPTSRLAMVRRIATFASTFGHVFSHLNPEPQPFVNAVGDPRYTHSKKLSEVRSVVTQTGSSGTVVIAFADGLDAQSELLLSDGTQMPIALGDQLVGWYLLDADLCGAGRLDYANICPLTVIDRSIAVFFGPAGFSAQISIGGRPLQAVIPKGKEPLVLSHEGITVILCNQQQVDDCVVSGNSFLLGAASTSIDGTPRRASGYKEVVALSHEQRTPITESSPSKRKPRTVKLHSWAVHSEEEFANGTSPRFASLEGPSSLVACGSHDGFGWYRIKARSKGKGKQTCLLPLGGDRLAWYVDGSFHHVSGVGPGAEQGQFDLKLSAGQHTIVVLADNLGRLDGGNELHEVKGVASELYEVKKLSGVKHHTVQGPTVSPFDIRPNVFGLGGGEQSQATQFTWTFEHAKKAPLIVDIENVATSGCLLLNDEPLIYYPGDQGIGCKRLVLSLEGTAAMKRGKNTLRFAPDPGRENPEEILKGLSVLECTDVISNVGWSFARWEVPSAKSFDEVNPKDASSKRGIPCWWRTVIEGNELSNASQPLWCDVSSMSKGQLYFNGHNVGRYFNTTSDGQEVPGQALLNIPDSWVLPEETNELLLFDEHGFSPYDMSLVRAEFGSRDR